MDGRLFNFVHIGSGLGKQVLPSKVTAAGFSEISQTWRNRVGGEGTWGETQGKCFLKFQGMLQPRQDQLGWLRL